MGKYVNIDSKGNGLPASYSGKIESLIRDGAEKVENIEFQPNLICVVDNGNFASAGYCYNEQEFNDFSDPEDLRKKSWLIHPKVEELTK